MPNTESIKTWVRFGVEHGWCSPLVCSTHSVDYLTDEELEVMSDGDDPCAFVLRVWDA